MNVSVLGRSSMIPFTCTGIIIANLAAKRIHVLQIPKENAPKDPSPCGTLVGSSRVGNADLQIFHTKGRTGASYGKPGEQSLQNPEPNEFARTATPTEKVEDETFMSSVYKEVTPQVTPRKENPEKNEDVVTTRTVLPFETFHNDQPSGSGQKNTDCFQKASIVINPRENIQTTIILDDTSSVSTSLPVVT